MNRTELIKKYIDFFKKKGHVEIPNASLIPANDPTVLFTTAGMHPLVPYLLGQKHPLGKRLVNVQRCIRTGDIEEVGDTTHHTFFEMLGNWALGDYWKSEAIGFSYEFLTKVLKLDEGRIAVTCFGGDKRVPSLLVDKEAADIWLSVGMPQNRIAFLQGGVFESKKNWWGPAGKTGPCGPDTEMFYWRPMKKNAPKTFDPDDNNWVEIWNDVLMQYEKNETGEYLSARQKNIDTGMGVERTLAVLAGFEDNYLTDSFLPIIKHIEKTSGKKYGQDKEITKSMRIIADHIKASVFIIADGVLPSNSEQGYVLRRLVRRAVRHGRNLGLHLFTKKIAESVFVIYKDYDILKNKEKILNELVKEEEKFLETLEKGMKVFEKLKEQKKISGKDAFLLYQSYGFPLEMTEELAREKKFVVDREGFYAEEKKHQELSRTAAEGKFKSGLADSSIETTRLHTATHLLNEALRKILGNDVKQRGSNITPERLRFDFSFDRKLTNEEIKKVEDLVNKKIHEGLTVVSEEMSLEKAFKEGAQAEFGHKYPEKISVYTVLDPTESKKWFSKEICTGPHVTNTKDIGTFKIIKEEASSAGVRRIKAVFS